MNLGFLGKGLGAAAGGFLSGGVLGLKEEQRQREKAQDQELRQAQIDSLNAQRNASKTDPKKYMKDFALSSAKWIQETLNHPNNYERLKDNPGYEKSLRAHLKNNIDYINDKLPDYLYDPNEQQHLIDADNASLANYQMKRQGPLGSGAPPASPFGAGEAEAKLAGDPNASPGLAMFGGLPQMQLPDIGSAGMQPPSTQGPMLGGMQPGSASIPGAYQKMAGAPPAAPEKAVRPAPPAPPQAAAAPPLEPTLEEQNKRALSHYQQVMASEPTIEQVMADRPNASRSEQEDELHKREDKWNQRVTQAYQQTQVFNKQATGEADAKSRPSLNDAALRQRLAAAGLSETKIREILDPKSIKNKAAADEADRKKRETDSNIARRAAQTAHDGVMASIAKINSATGQRNAATSERGQKDLSKHRGELQRHMKVLEKNGAVSPLLQMKFKTFWAKLSSGRTSISGVGSFGAGNDASMVAEERGLMAELQAEMTASGGGAAAATGGGGSSAGVPQEMQDAINETPEYGSFNTRMKGLKAKNPAAYAAAADAYQKMKGKPYQFPGAGKKKKK